MLTKEECEKALDHFEKCYWDQDNSYGAMNGVRKDLEILNKLIHEHFSNPPLKFEELEEGMWIWDSQLKWFFRISICNVKIENFEYIKLFKVEKYEGGSMLMFYEPNRFYRKEVRE